MKENPEQLATLAANIDNLRAELQSWRATANRDEMVELLGALRQFVSCFQLVFDHDWDYTRTQIEDPEGWFIDKEGTFIDPMVGDEENNWANRGSLLSAYRHLVACMKICRVQADFWDE